MKNDDLSLNLLKLALQYQIYVVFRITRLVLVFTMQTYKQLNIVLTAFFVKYLFKQDQKFIITQIGYHCIPEIVVFEVPLRPDIAVANSALRAQCMSNFIKHMY